MRRCSFSSSVLARFRGGRLVFGSGRTWPHDFRFLTDLASEPDGAGVDDGSDMDGNESEGEVGSKTSSCSILMVVGTESVREGVRGVAVIVLVLIVW